ncbi:MAG: type II toxin-antitoxin system RelE/ParE family toxin [Acidobacteriota bacterium]
MTDYVLTPLAAADVFHIWSYIADANPDAADRVEQAIYDACTLLAAGPLRGHVRRDLTKRPLRFWSVTSYPNYLIAYRPETTPLQVVAVLHSRRNLRVLLDERP